MSKKNNKLSSNAGLLLSLAVAAANVGAQGLTLEEVVVTAQKREQNIQDIPIAISAFDAGALKDKGVDDFSKLGTLTPGLNLAPSTGFYDPVVTIRGIGLRFEEPNVSASAAVHLDEVAMVTPTYLNIPLFDLERVEVLKGPQGTLFGQNTTAGALNFITKKPDFESSGYIDISHGKFNETDVEFAYGGALSDRVAGRIAVKYTDSDGHQENLGTTRTAGFTRVPGVIPGIPERKADGDFAGLDKIAVRTSLLFDVSDDVEVFTSIHYFNDESEVPLVKLDGADALGMLPASDDEYTVEGDEDGVNDHEQWGGQFRVDWDLGFATFTSLTGYEQLNRHQVDSEGSATRILNEDLYNESWMFSQEFRLVGSTDLVNWTIGLNYAEDEVDFFKRQDASDAVLGFLDTDYVRKVDGWAVFGQADWALSETLTLTTGLRYLEEDREMDRKSLGFDPYGTSQIALVFPDIPILPEPDQVSADEVTWRLGLDWRPTDNLLLYGSVSKGFKSGGFDGSGITSVAALAPFEGEELIAYEAGFKWTSENHPLRINGSAFFYDYENLQAQSLVTIVGAGGTTVQDAILTNAGIAEIKGAEFDLHWQPLEGLLITGGATYLDGEITEFESADAAAAASVEGNDTPNTPELQTSLQVSYEHPVSNGDYYVRAFVDYSYIDSVYADIDNDELLVIEGYEVFGSRIEFSPESADWSVGIWGKNLKDERYFTSVAPAFLAAPGVVRRSYAMPRTYGIDFKYNF